MKPSKVGQIDSVVAVYIEHSAPEWATAFKTRAGRGAGTERSVVSNVDVSVVIGVRAGAAESGARLAEVVAGVAESFGTSSVETDAIEVVATDLA